MKTGRKYQRNATKIERFLKVSSQVSRKKRCFVDRVIADKKTGKGAYIYGGKSMKRGSIEGRPNKGNYQTRLGIRPMKLNGRCNKEAVYKK